MRDLQEIFEESGRLVETARRLIELTSRELARARQMRDAARQACSDSRALINNGGRRREPSR